MPSTNKEILTQILNREILETVNNIEASKEYNFVINENLNNSNKDIQENDVFIVFTFGNAQMGYRETLYTVSFNIYCNQNDVDEIQEVFNVFVTSNNLKKIFKDNHYIIQSYTTPAVITRYGQFNEFYGALLGFTCSFLITPTCTPITNIQIQNTSVTPAVYEEMYFLKAALSYSNASDQKSVPSTYNAYSQSTNQFGTTVLTMSLYFDATSPFISKCLGMSNPNNASLQDSEFSTKVKINNVDYTYTLKVQYANIGQTQEGIPTFEVCMAL